MGLRIETPTRCLLCIVTLTALCLGIAVAALWPSTASAVCARGIVDNRLEYSNQVPLVLAGGLSVIVIVIASTSLAICATSAPTSANRRSPRRRRRRAGRYRQGGADACQPR